MSLTLDMFLSASVVLSQFWWRDVCAKGHENRTWVSVSAMTHHMDPLSPRVPEAVSTEYPLSAYAFLSDLVFKVKHVTKGRDNSFCFWTG